MTNDAVIRLKAPLESERHGSSNRHSKTTTILSSIRRDRKRERCNSNSSSRRQRLRFPVSSGFGKTGSRSSSISPIRTRSSSSTSSHSWSNRTRASRQWSHVYTVIDTAVCALDRLSKQFDVAPDGAPLAQIFPAVVDGIVIVDRQVSSCGNRIGVSNSKSARRRFFTCSLRSQVRNMPPPRFERAETVRACGACIARAVPGLRLVGSNRVESRVPAHGLGRFAPSSVRGESCRLPDLNGGQLDLQSSALPV